jgi:flavin reductase (DIM6/NTAB) family NADH-FMN oxidoreductase RutF
VTDKQGIARLTRVATPTSSSGLMPPPRPLRGVPPPAPGKGEPIKRGLLPTTGVATLTPKAAKVEEEARALRRVMGRFATGVTVITTYHRDTIHGMTANAFLSVSLRPPLVLVSLGRCRMGEMLPHTKRYGVSVLAHDQEHFAEHFSAQRISQVEPTFVWHDGLPLLEGALAHLVCRVVDVHVAGDHELWIGQVKHLSQRDGDPLLFYTGRFGTVRDLKKNF